ncbi:MAG TPA: DMT family transporter [Anaerolineales bacterium]|nr:DMT family transporter [Anaerolineales bacterium]
MPVPRHPHWTAYLALSIGIITLGFSAIFTRWADAPGAVVSFYRMGIGTVALAVPFVARWNRRRAISRRGLLLALLAGIFFALDLATWSTGIALEGATIPTLLGNMAPVVVALGAWLLFKEKLNVSFWLGLLLAIGGVIAVLNLDFSRGLVIRPGALFGLAAGFFYGVYFLITQKGREELDALSFFWLATLSSTITLLILSLFLENPLAGYSIFTYLNFLALGLIVQGAGWLAINYAQGYLPASLVAPTLLSQPVLTAILAGPLLGERFTLVEWLGGAVVVLGIVIVHRSHRRSMATAGIQA